MFDLVAKIQNIPMIKPGSFAALTPRQFDIATAMQGKGRLSAADINKSIGLPRSIHISVFMRELFRNKVVSRIPKTINKKKVYVYSLIVESFALKGAKA